MFLNFHYIYCKFGYIDHEIKIYIYSTKGYMKTPIITCQMRIAKAKTRGKSLRFLFLQDH